MGGTLPAYARPASQWFGRKLAEVKQTAAANTAGSTEYTLEVPERKAGDTRKEHERAESVAIIGNLSHDHKGKATGLTGFGHAVYDTETKAWVKVQ
jgi:hypothetical protein